MSILEMKKYFKKLINKYHFICIMPFVVMIPLFTFLIKYFNGENLSNEGTLSNKELQTVSLITFGLYLIIPLIVSSIYLFTYNKYKKQISSFSKSAWS